MILYAPLIAKETPGPTNGSSKKVCLWPKDLGSLFQKASPAMKTISAGGGGFTMLHQTSVARESTNKWYACWLPSGYVKIAIENDHRNSGFPH